MLSHGKHSSRGARFLALLVIVGGCADRERGPLVAGTDESGLEPPATDGTPPVLLAPSPRSSGAIAASPLTPLAPQDSNTWIFVNFAGRMDVASAAGVIVHTEAGMSLPLAHDWSVGANTGLVVRPTERLLPNTLHVVRLVGALLLDQAGNALDVDGDGIGGERPDDDLVFFFRTQREGDAFLDQDRDGSWDSGSVFLDRDANGVFEPPPAGPDTLLHDTFDDGSGAPEGDGVLNPVEPLIIDHNQNGIGDPGDEWFDNIQNGVWDAEGEALTIDLNGNGVYDAPAPGDPVPLLLDGFPPVLLPFATPPVLPGGDSFVHFAAAGKTNTLPFVDAAVAVRVLDEALHGGVVEHGGVRTPLPPDPLVLEEVDSGVRVSGVTTYETAGGLDDDSFGRLSFLPARELRPGIDHRLTVSGALADTAGNKLDRDRDGWADSGIRPFLTRTFRTLDRRADGTVVTPDILPPQVVEFASDAASFVVVFSELVDPRTLTDATIRLVSDGRRVHGLITLESRFLGDPNQGPEVRLVTAARFLPTDPAVRAGRVTVTTGVRDFAALRLERPVFWDWVAR